MCEKKVNMNLINLGDDAIVNPFGEEMAGNEVAGSVQVEIEEQPSNLKIERINETNPFSDVNMSEPFNFYSMQPPLMPNQMYQQYYSAQPEILNREMCTRSEQKYAELERVLDDEKHLNFENKHPMCIYYPVAINNPFKPPESSRQFSLNEIVGLIGEFDGENSSVLFWIQTVEHWSKVYNWKDLEILKYASSRLVGAARLWYNGYTLKINSWEQLKDAIVREFPGRFTEADIHSRLRAMTKRTDESYVQFAYRVSETAARGNVSEESAVVYIVSGLSYDPIYNDVRCGNYSTIKQLVDHIKQICIYKSYDQRSRLPKIKERTHEAKTSNAPTSPPKSEKRIVRRQCFKCNSTEHMIKDCPQNSTVRNNSTSNSTSTIHAVNKKDKCLTMNQDGISSCVLSVAGSSWQRYCLIDTGSPYSLIRKSRIPANSRVLSTNHTCTGLNSSTIEVTGVISVNLSCSGITSDVDLLVVADNTMNIDILLGRDYMNQNKVCYVKLDWGTTEYPSEMCPVKEEAADAFENMNIEEIVSALTDEYVLDVGDDPETCSRYKDVNSTYNQYYKNYVRPSKPKVEHEIEVKFKKFEDYYSNPQRFSVYEKQELRKMIQEYLDAGVIKESESPHTSRIVLTKKKNGSLRMCVDFRKLNKLVIRDHFPIPNIEDQLSKLHGKKYFSGLDMKSGFHHVKIHPDSTKYFAFVTDEGVYEFVRMPFGYCNAPEAFVRYMSKVLKPLIDAGEVIVFFDDILVATDSLEKHLIVLEKLFTVLAENHVELNLEKCTFLKTKIKYLGYEVSENSIQPSDEHIRSIQSIPPPENQSQLHRFMGLVGYFRKFIKGFSQIADPLYYLLKKDSTFEFGDRQLSAFNKLKEIMVTKPVLTIYSPHAETELHTDASSSGFGGILLQRGEDSKMHPVMYYSRRATEPESRLHSFELETLAIIYSLQRFKPYVHGVHFKIVTDCQALQLTLNKKDINPKIGRWALYIDQFDCEMIHRSGEKMKHVDALSRLYIHSVHKEKAISNLYEESLYVAQIGDERIKTMKQEIEKGKHDGYCVMDNLVYKEQNGNYLLYIPESMEQSLMYQFHDFQGHFGRDKVLSAMKKYYWFPNMKSKIEKHISTCLMCLSFNPKPFKFDGYLQLVDKPSQPWEVVHIDHLGPLELTKGKNQHVLAVCDAFTKFIKLYATKTTNTKEVMKHMKSYFMTYSTPKVIISDRGTAFQAKDFNKFSETHSFQHVMVATACPQANGQIERYNKTLVPLLAKLVETSGENWDNVLNEAEYLLNNSFNKAIDAIPAEVLFGVKQNRSIDNRICTYAQELSDKNNRNLEEIRLKVKETNLQNQKYNREYRNRKCKVQTVYEEGDHVLIRTTPIAGESNKLKPRYKGPYLVSKVLDRNRYFLTDIEGYQCTQRRFTGIFDPTNMKLYPSSALPKEVDYFDEDDLEDLENSIDQ